MEDYLKHQEEMEEVEWRLPVCVIRFSTNNFCSSVFTSCAGWGFRWDCATCCVPVKDSCKCMHAHMFTYIYDESLTRMQIGADIRFAGVECRGDAGVCCRTRVLGKYDIDDEGA